MPEKKNGKGIPQGIQGKYVTHIFHMKIISQEFFSPIFLGMYITKSYN